MYHPLYTEQLLGHHFCTVYRGGGGYPPMTIDENLFLELDSEQSETEQNHTGGACSGENPIVRPGQLSVRQSIGSSPTAMVQAAIGGGAVAMERIETIDTGSSTLNNLWRPNTNTNTDSSRDLATLDCKFAFSVFPKKDPPGIKKI